LPGSPAHLFARFFDVATAQRLTPSERASVTVWLPPSTEEVFFSQDDADQRHGYQAALSVLASGVEERGVVMAALLHDVGKRHARLGLIGRTIASLLILFHLPLPERMAIYRDHGAVAARELGVLGVPSLVIDFALHHHGRRPPTIAPRVWDVLMAADQPPKASARLRARITSDAT